VSGPQRSRAGSRKPASSLSCTTSSSVAPQLRGDCACQSSGSPRPPLNRGDRGKAGEGVLGTPAQVVAESQRFSERLVGGCAVIAQECGQPDVVERVQPLGGLLQVARQGDGAIEITALRFKP